MQLCLSGQYCEIDCIVYIYSIDSILYRLLQNNLIAYFITYRTKYILFSAVFCYHNPNAFLFFFYFSLSLPLLFFFLLNLLNPSSYTYLYSFYGGFFYCRTLIYIENIPDSILIRKLKKNRDTKKCWWNLYPNLSGSIASSICNYLRQVSPTITIIIIDAGYEMWARGS